MNPNTLRVTADLRLDVDGVQAKIDGDGTQVTVAVDDAVALATRLRDVSQAVPSGLAARRRALTRAVRALDDAGLTVTVSDAGGPLLRAGRDARSRVSRLVLSNPHVQLVRRRETVATLVALLRPRRR